MSHMKRAWATLDRICEEEGWGREAGERGRRPPPVSVSRRLEFADEDDETATVREVVTMSFGDEGLPLAQLPDAMRAVTAKAPGGPARAAKVGRNAPCPCGSEADAPSRQERSEAPGSVPVAGIRRRRRPAEHAYRTQRHHTRGPIRLHPPPQLPAPPRAPHPS